FSRDWSSDVCSSDLSLPALDFKVEDLRVGRLELGQAELQAHPGEDGLRVDRFATRAAGFELDASGHWRRVGEGRAQSAFTVGFQIGRASCRERVSRS